MIHTIPNASIVLFGATGDLAHRKLFPALYQLYQKGHMKENFSVVGVSRKEYTHEEFQAEVASAINEHAPNADIDIVKKFSSHFYYLKMDVTSKPSYHELEELLNVLDRDYQTNGNRLYYLAMAPSFFGIIPTFLKSEGITNTEGWQRIVIEKPFGHDLPSATKLNEEIQQSFNEDDIYRIDHYLGKEMVQNIQVIRFGNAIFESIWNNKYIDSVQITSSETLGVEDRAAYYEKSGALLDMVQNHMLQMVMMVAMEPPGELKPEHIRDEKVKVLRSLRFFNEEEVKRNVIRAQYSAGKMNGEQVPGYLQEENVAPESQTETFVAAKLFIDNFRWTGVPFYIRTGKRMAVKSTEIVIQFKQGPMALYHAKTEKYQPNLLRIHVQPDEGVSLTLNAKPKGDTSDLLPIDMTYNNKTTAEMNSPEAYEKLLHDCLLGNSTYFTRWDEVALSWDFIDRITKAWADGTGSPVTHYPSGSMGPVEADELLNRDGHSWWEPTKVREEC
ncbi:glucose-6-phosphate dehydrogenase [Fictibacillus phosphorivorans]|uniref:Glucose-6-phosphate 1-dehydrogenase n=1 Tax=Fictibacillus phosphorivorans TaxID=1221500 RepID=A0A165NGX6_9BACL|nr:glucose-6-phosphate dehydrogenase [Fictibacillus phosphorivorans]KZE66017.1 glucose-6-phosphate dehydrogenase [Fictibacillus phosphorivorans]